jgi:hypothetical protein
MVIYWIANHEAAHGPTGWTSQHIEAYEPAVTIALTYADQSSN